MLRPITILALVLFSLSSIDSNAQLMKKLKQKAGKGLLKEIGVSDDEKEEEEEKENTNAYSSNNSNSRGGGLKIAPPDVSANISDAKSSLDGKKYSQARFAIQEAMRGVELEIGEKILESFPSSVSSLSYNEERDQIVTSGIGFVGLNIGRHYEGGDQELEVLINNNSVMVSSVNLYLTNPSYTQSGQSDGTQYKRTTIQGNTALIQYSDRSGYQLSVPLGQSTLFVMKCINFNTEDDVVSASDKFDLNEIKSLLGEN